MTIAVDFDGTICDNKFPACGLPKSDIIDSLKAMRENGHKIILFSCREGKYLEEALAYCKNFGLEFDAVNENLPELIDKFGCDCRKIGADIYIDDKSIQPNDLIEAIHVRRNVYSDEQQKAALIEEIKKGIQSFHEGLPFEDDAALAEHIFNSLFVLT